MKTRDLAAVATAILNFQNGRHWKLKIAVTLVYMWIFAWNFVYVWPAVSQIIPNLRTYHMIPVIASLFFKMAATENSKLL